MLYHLDLGSNQFTSLNKHFLAAFNNLKCLKEINLKCNMINTIDEITLANLKITNFQILNDLDNFTKINLNNNRIEAMDKSFFLKLPILWSEDDDD